MDDGCIIIINSIPVTVYRTNGFDNVYMNNMQMIILKIMMTTTKTTITIKITTIIKVKLYLQHE